MGSLSALAEERRARHGLRPEDRVERCHECGKRLVQHQHELCPRCDTVAFDRMPLLTEVRL